MDTELILSEMANILMVDRESLTNDFILTQANWDSMGLLLTIAMLDEQLGINISGRSLRQCTTIKQLLDLISEKKTTTS